MWKRVGESMCVWEYVCMCVKLSSNSKCCVRPAPMQSREAANPWERLKTQLWPYIGYFLVIELGIFMLFFPINHYTFNQVSSNCIGLWWTKLTLQLSGYLASRYKISLWLNHYWNLIQSESSFLIWWLNDWETMTKAFGYRRWTYKVLVLFTSITTKSDPLL